ncbi:MAG: hypothetical protein ACREQV_15485 [Candidatus Binatia bacterium]
MNSKLAALAVRLGQMVWPILIAIVITGCAGEQGTGTDPTDTTDPTFSGESSLLCQVGCVEHDPNPSAPGYYLGSGVKPGVCTNGSHTDGDQDDTSDFCEKEIAAAFAPQLYYWKFDEIGREPYWVAEYDDGFFEVVYLLSYYRDAGSSSPGCSLPGAPSSCFGHNGDSEWIYLAATYDEGTALGAS